MTARWPRGSEWRKWDLHLHAPGTKQNDQFRVSAGGDLWEEYCRRLDQTDVQAFGITDYFSADTYFTARDEFTRRYPASQKALFANIELRTNDVVNKAQEEVNIHLIFNPLHTDHDDKIRSLLVALKTNKTGAEGREVRAAELQREADFAEATTTRAFIREALEETFGKSVDLLDRVLIVTAANNDGIRAERGKKRKLLISDEFDKFSQAFFGSTVNTDWYLSTDRGEDKSQQTTPKAVLSGCDAHSLADLDAKLGQVVSDSTGIVLEPTWIKADLTFEGLKQIVFEPANRVFIGAEPEVERRVRENRTLYIESLCIDAVDGYRPELHGTWFVSERIPLGKELVAVIGNKGGGKSALTDIIGLLGNSHNQVARGLAPGKPDELFSFLNKEKFLKGGFAKHFVGILNWYDGPADRRLLDAQTAPHLTEKVEYLPQKYLERICANIADDEFRATLNEVIFRYVKPQDQFGAASLDELINFRTRQAEENIANKKGVLHAANAVVVEAERRLSEEHRAQLDERIRLRKAELAAHASIQPPARPNPEATGTSASTEAAQLDALSRRRSELAQRIEELSSEQVHVSRRVEDLRQVRQAIARETGTVFALEAKWQSVLSAAGLSFSQIVQLRVEYAGLDREIEVCSTRLQQIQSLLLSKVDLDLLIRDDAAKSASREKAMADSLVCALADLDQERAELVERLGKPAREYQQYLAEQQAWAAREKELRGADDNPSADSLVGLERELARVGEVYPQELLTARAARDRVARELFSQKLGLTTFYDAIKASIDAEIAKCRGELGEYDIAVEASLRFDATFFDSFLRHINQGAAGSFRGQHEGHALLRELTDTVTDWKDEKQVFSALDSIVEALHLDRRPDFAAQGASRDIFKQMKGQKQVQDLYDYLYDFDYLMTKYDLKVDHKDLSELSPGERGGLLLIFYLMLDRQATPLVIDQPEDNLDNKSVYEILVTFIKQAKKRRQIILVTHNPNLAVVADAEQIISVSIDKKSRNHDFSFFSGSIEEPRINRAVVDILEGTLPAFDNRRLKYRKHSPGR
ncbi:MAG: AAA family ATPase [Burkholderiales bacterium]|nr:AAA family ATPase [Burkholderiales bacterium]